MLTSVTSLFYHTLGNWWVFSILFALSGIMFGYLVPRAQKAIFAQVTTDLPSKVLDVHVKSDVLFLPGARVSPGIAFRLAGAAGNAWLAFRCSRKRHTLRDGTQLPDLSSFALKFGPLFT